MKRISLFLRFGALALCFVYAPCVAYVAGKHDGYAKGIATMPMMLRAVPNDTPREHAKLSYATDESENTIIIGPSAHTAPGVALYSAGKSLGDCFTFRLRSSVTFEGFLNNDGTVTPTKEWITDFCK